MPKPTVMIVDDDPSIRSLLKTVLESEDFAVIEASDGEAVLKMARNERPDVLVLDLMMPKMDGETVIRQVWAEPGLVGTPIIVISAKHDALPDLRNLVGDQNVFAKPFEEQVLVDRIKQITQPRQD